MSVNGIQNTSFPLTLSGLTLTDDLSSTYIPYSNASNAIDLNNKTVSNVASLSVVGTVTASGTVSSATVTSSGAVNGSSLVITNHATSNSLAVGSYVYTVTSIQAYTTTLTFTVNVTNMPWNWVVGDTIQVTNIYAFPATFNRVYIIRSFNGTTGFNTDFYSGGFSAPYYQTGAGLCYRTTAPVVGQVISDSIKNINNTTSGTLTSLGPIICNSTSSIGYWLPINGTTSIYMTDTSSNVSTPATTFSRYFATSGNVYQDFYGTFYWRGSTTLNAGNVVQRMSLSSTALNIAVPTAITGTFDVTGNSLFTGTVGITGATGITGALSQTGGTQTFSLGSYGSSGDYIVPTTNIYGSSVFDGGNMVNIQNQASQYGRNILYLTGRYEASNDAWAFYSPRNAIIFRTQATLNASATNRYTIQNYYDQLGILCAGKSSIPVTKWANDGTLTHTDNMSIGGVLVLTKVGDGVLQLSNTATIQAKNSTGTYENFIWARASDNVTYMNYGANGFNIRSNTSNSTMFMTSGGKVGIGNTSPITMLDVYGGPVNFWTGTRYATINGYMADGSLTLGSISASYGGGTSGWSSNTAALLFETNANTEIAVHHSGVRIASMLYYQGSSNTMFIGRDMGGGWGTSNTSIQGTLSAQSTLTVQGLITSNSSILLAQQKNLYWSDVGVDSRNGICWNGDTANNYAISRSAGAWSAPNYQQLLFNWATGFTFTCGGATYGKSYVDFQCKTKVSNGNESITTYGPNSSCNVSLVVGSATANYANSTTAQVFASDGNLHLDCASAKALYLNFYSANRPIMVCGQFVGNDTRYHNFGRTSSSNNQAIVADFNNFDGSWIGATFGSTLCYDRVVAGGLNSSGNFATIGAHNYNLTAWATLSIANPSFWYPSDETLKENINTADYNICYENIKKLRVARYNYKEDGPARALNKRDKTVLGVIAQELQEIFPKSIGEQEDPESKTKFLTINNDQLNFCTMGALKHLQDIVEKQQNQIAVLSNHMIELTNQLNELTKKIKISK